MKINYKLIAVLFSVLALYLSACSDGGSDSGGATVTDLPAPEKGYFRINYLGSASELWL